MLQQSPPSFTDGVPSLRLYILTVSIMLSLSVMFLLGRHSAVMCTMHSYAYRFFSHVAGSVCIKAAVDSSSMPAKNNTENNSNGRMGTPGSHFNSLMLHLIWSDRHHHHHHPTTTHDQLLRHPSFAEDSRLLKLRRESSDQGGPSSESLGTVSKELSDFCGVWTLSNQVGQSEFLEAMQLNWVMRKAAESVKPPNVTFFIDEVGAA